MTLANYPDDSRRHFYENYMSARNKEYCELHNIEYIEYTHKINSMDSIRGDFSWLKFRIINNYVDSGFLQDGDIITYIDADMCYVKPEIEYPCNKSFTYSIDSGNTHCMGSFSVKIDEWSKNMMKLIMDEQRFQDNINITSVHEAFGHTSSFWREFREQASWYSLAGIKRHSWKPFWDYDNYGWHSDYRENTIYTLEELHDHVEVLPTTCNVTEVEGESGCEFLINKVPRDEIIIRHFAGGQPWRPEWFKK